MGGGRVRGEVGRRGSGGAATPSGNRIDYRIRPAKHIERKMMLDTFRKLDAFDQLSNYRYVGFGSIYFADFSLFHRALGIKDMVSIELDLTRPVRYRSNAPYGCIRVLFEHSNTALPKLDWNGKTIAWLDYDYPIDSTVLSDIATVIDGAQSGTVVVVTVDVTARALSDKPRDRLLEDLGDEKFLPAATTDASLQG